MSKHPGHQQAQLLLISNFAALIGPRKNMRVLLSTTVIIFIIHPKITIILSPPSLYIIAHQARILTHSQDKNNNSRNNM